MPHIRVHPNGLPLLTTTVDLTLTFRSQVVSVDPDATSPVIVSLPPVSTERAVDITIVNTGTTGTVTLDAYLLETVNGALTYDILPGDVVTIVSMGGGWVLGGSGGGGGGEVYSDTDPNLGVSTFQGAVESLLVGSPSTSFIYNSSGIQGGTRYNSWPDLMTAIAINRYGGPRSILFEQDETLPAGAYDLTDITLLGNGISYGQSITDTLYVTLPTGFTLTADRFTISTGLNVESTSTAPIMTVTTARPVLITLRDASGLASTTAPFLYYDPALTPGVTSGVIAGGKSANLFGAGGTMSDPPRPLGGHELVSDDSGQFIVLASSESGVVWDDDLVRCSAGAAASSFLFSYVADATARTGLDGPVTSLTHANYTGTAFSSNLARGSQVAFTAIGSTGMWVGGDPATVSAAIDQLAATVSGVVGGALPNI